MIICFSGTGNSRMIAETIQKLTDEDIVMFAPGLLRNPEYIRVDVNDDRILWVAPVHAWSVPWLCRKIVEKAKLVFDGPVTNHLILSCGDDIGNADIVWRKLMQRRGWQTGSVYSVQMPNTFVGMKGFDIDSKELAKQKLEAMPSRVEAIINSLDNESGQVTDVVRGSWPKLKTSVISPVFHKVIMKPTHFHVTDDCIRCGRCARNCPTANITIGADKPQFGDHCTMCFRCFHICQQNAVQYGKATAGKGQYLCPGQTFSK